MKKRSKIIALALTFVMAIGFTAGTFAYNKHAANVAETPNRYYNGTNCVNCTPDTVPEGFECTTTPNPENIRCTCNLQTQMATTNGADGTPPCELLYQNPIL